MKIKLTYHPGMDTEIPYISVYGVFDEPLAHVYSDMSKTHVKWYYVDYLEDRLKSTIRQCFANDGFVNGTKIHVCADYYVSELTLEM